MHTHTNVDDINPLHIRVSIRIYRYKFQHDMESKVYIEESKYSYECRYISKDTHMRYICICMYVYVHVHVPAYMHPPAIHMQHLDQESLRLIHNYLSQRE